MSALRLVIFDVDGTLVDSQRAITAAMTAAFAALDRPAPAAEAVRRVVGLSLPVAIAALAPDLAPAEVQRAQEAYRAAFAAARETGEAAGRGALDAPLFPGARAALDHLAGEPDVLLGIATGKSARGLEALLQAHGLGQVFVTRQVADHHPSKPHPAMIEAALAETGVSARDAVMVGDTTFDMEMARAAGVAGLAVGWGYHPPAELAPLAPVLDSFAALPGALQTIWRQPA